MAKEKLGKVKIIEPMAGEGFVWNIGDEVEMSVSEAVRLIAKGYAIDLKEEKPKE